MPENRSLEKQIINTVRQSQRPLKPLEVQKRVAAKAKARPDAVHEMIISLVDQGLLKVTLDLRLRAR